MEYFIEADQIDLNATFNCGQCFRWNRCQDGIYIGFVGSKTIKVRQEKNGLTLLNTVKKDIPYWERYFCADMDYSALIKRFSEDATLKKACEFAPGIRVLRQEPYETLISFIISQNNNIKRITSIIEKICAEFGNESFSNPSVLASLSEQELTAVGAGYRARYIVDAAKKVNSGKIILDEIAKMPYNVAKGELLKIVGVGDKVADCVLLFGFNKMEAFPKDVWVKRAIAEYYPVEKGFCGALPDCTKGYEGLAQQFLFHYIRMNSR